MAYHPFRNIWLKIHAAWLGHGNEASSRAKRMLFASAPRLIVPICAVKRPLPSIVAGGTSIVAPTVSPFDTVAGLTY